MSDQNTSLPVRTQADGTDERMHVKIVDGTNPSVNQATVDSDKNVHIEAHGNQPLGTDAVLALSENGEARINGVYNASTNSLPSKVGVVTSSRNATPSDTTQINRVTSIQSATVVAVDVSLHDQSGNPYTNVNPLPVSIEESVGNEVNDYQTNAALAAGGTVNHDYLITSGKSFKLRKVFASASGKMKITVQISPDGTTFTTKFVGFNSTANPCIDIMMPGNVSVTEAGNGTAKIRIIHQNNDNQPQDVYSTITGIEE